MIQVVIQREALSLVNHLIDSPSKELEVSCSYLERNHFHISLKISFKCSLVFYIHHQTKPRCQCPSLLCPFSMFSGRWWPATLSNGRTLRSRGSSRWWTGSLLVRWSAQSAQWIHLQFWWLIVILMLKGVCSGNDVPLGPFYISQPHWLQQGGHASMIPWPSFLFCFFHRYPHIFSEAGDVEGHARCVQGGDKTAQGGNRL